MKNIVNIDFTQVYSAAGHEATGTVVENALGLPFMFVKQIGATTSAAGEWAAMATTGISVSTIGYVSRTAATSLVNAVSTVALAAGVFQSALATGSFGWVQIGGVGVTALAVTDTNIAAGDPLVIDGGATPVGATDTMADGEEESCCGFALTADNGSVQDAYTYTIINHYGL